MFNLGQLEQWRRGLKSSRGSKLQFIHIRYKFSTEEMTVAQNFNFNPPSLQNGGFSTHKLCTFERTLSYKKKHFRQDEI